MHCVATPCLSQQEGPPAKELQVRRHFSPVTRTKVEAVQWLEGGEQLVYRVDSDSLRFDYLIADTKTGAIRVAFDLLALATALRDALGETVDLTDRSIGGLVFSDGGRTMHFAMKGMRWTYDVEDQKLRSGDKSVELRSGVELVGVDAASRNEGGETVVEFDNQMDHSVDLHWVRGDGTTVPYWRILPGARRLQSTHAGHVFLLVDRVNDKELVVRATKSTGYVAIGSTPWNKPATASRARTRGVAPNDELRAYVKGHNLWVSEIDGANPWQATKDGTATDPYMNRFHWSPDSTRLIAYQEQRVETREIALVESAPPDQLQPKLHMHRYPKPGDSRAEPRLRLCNVQDRRMVPVRESIVPHTLAVRAQVWSPQSDEFICLLNDRGRQLQRVIALDANTGAVRSVVEERSDTFIDLNGRTYMKYLPATGELIWMSERDGFSHLYLYDMPTGTVKNQITQGEFVVDAVDSVDAESRTIRFRGLGYDADQNPYFHHHFRVGFDGLGLTRMTAGNGTHAALEFSPDQRVYIDRYSRVDEATVTELRRSVDGTLVCELARGNFTARVQTGWRPPTAFVAKGRDGETDIYGILHFPTAFDENAKYPVVEQIYAGPHGSHVPVAFRATHGAQEVADLGFIVVQIDGMGTANRSKAFHDVAWQNLGDSGFPDRIPWIRAAAKQYPQMDLARVGIYGGSAGGQSAMRALIAHGDFYKVAVADCGCHDNRVDKMWWNEQWMGWPIGPHYEEQSNATQAHRLTGKLMLIVGALDRNVDPACTMQVVEALVKADKNFDLVVLPSAGHGAAGTPYGKRRLREFLVEHLKN